MGSSGTKLRGLALALLLAVLMPATAHATDCTPSNGVSPCIDSDGLWVAPPTSRWMGISIGQPLARGGLAFGRGSTALWRPVVLDAPSPDPEGREIVVVGSALNTTIAAAIGVGSGIALDAALPMTLYQTGAGVQGLTSQSAPPIGSLALRDPRIGMALIRPVAIGHMTLLAQSRMEISLPLGDRDDLAGGRSAVGAPSLAVEAECGRLVLGSELGLRLRMPAELAGTRVGSELTAAVGVGVALDGHHRLSLQAEAWLRPSLVSQDRVLPDGTRIDHTASMPAEWLLTFNVVPDRKRRFRFGLGGGTGIPLSSERRTTPDGSTSETTFAAVTTPAVRLVAFVRFVL